MNILLIQPFKDTSLGRQSYPPVGLGYLAHNVSHLGEVNILDCLRENKSYNDFVKSLHFYKPDVVGISVFSISVPYVKHMVRIIRILYPKCKIVVGGPHISALPERTFDDFPEVDFGIRGEGEVPFKWLLETDFNSTWLRGVVYKDGKETRINEPYFAPNIEDYGYPAWFLIQPGEYFKYMNIGADSAPVFFSRGCPMSCTFCAAKVTSGQSLRKRSLNHIFYELENLRYFCKIRRFIIEDEGFGASKQFIMDFCQELLNRNFKARFVMGVGMRLDIVDSELLCLMREAGFEKRIALGIESGSQRILDLMKKHTTIELIKEKVNLMDSFGFEPTGYFMLGYPSETKQEMEETIRLALSLPIREAGFTAFQPLPATEATNELIENGELPKDYDFTKDTPNKITYSPKGTTLEELEAIRKSAILRFWLRPTHFWRCFNLFSVIKLFTIFFRRNTK